MIYKIESRQNERVKDLVKLSQLSVKKERKEFIIEGFHLLEMALNVNAVKAVYSTKKLDISEDIPQYIVTPEIMEKISSQKSPQGVVAICKMLEEKPISSDRVLYLDDVSDPGNVGTLLRTALAFGYKDVILTSKSCNPYNEKVIQASQGAIFNLNVVEDKENILKSMKNYQIYATEIKGSVELNTVIPSAKHVLILGNEAHGVSKEKLELSNYRIRIDIETIESLNVAIAGGIAMHYLSK